MYYIHMGASQRTITKDVEEVTRRWKARREIPERRVHTKKLPEYLQVWDLREGWTGDGYDLGQEKTLRQIAKKLGVPIHTAWGRYQSAFELITGHSFTPELWSRLLAPLKLSKTLGDAATIASAPMRRRLRTSVRRDVPESVVRPPRDGSKDTGFVESRTMIVDPEIFLIDLKDLLAKGLSDEQVAEKLEITEEVVRYARERFTEFGDHGDKTDHP